VYALVGGSIVTTLSITLSAWIFLANGWRPRWQFSLEDVKPYLGFGTALVGNNLVNRVNLNIDLLLGGRLLGADLLGLYSVPRNLILQIQFVVNPIITRVGFPLIAQIQHDIARVRSVYLQTLNMTASTNAPLYMAIVFFAADIVQVLLGRDWGGSVEFFKILAVWGFLRSTGNTVGSLLLGMGRADLSLKWNIGLLFVVPPALWVGSQFGTHGLAWTLLALSAALYIPGWLILVRPLCHAGLLKYALASFKPMALAICAFAIGHALAQQGGDALVRLLIGLPTSALIYLAFCYWWNRAWLRALHELIPLRRLRA
jgi:O-antigen/teichoic acid export membrane protein